MITAVDTSVLLDVFKADPTFGGRSSVAVRDCLAQGGLVACAVVWAELAGVFPSPAAAAGALERLGVSFGDIDRDAALDAGAAWKLYRSRGGRRDRMVADFLIGAHARGNADRLLSRDRGFFRTYFPKLALLDPSIR
ncbi:MAG: type II toxin-antitoxin system VapC family toxin [Deltaproteobacteria bacterium]|nr:type II toxin-antitoxin system VapC family toxin [Deltaproteobacteria bacterium]